MKIRYLRSLALIITAMVAFTLSSSASLPSGKIKEETVQYSFEGKQFTGFAAWDESLPGKRPVVLVVPEWWGLNDYPRERARQLAQLGYFAFAVDMYGEGQTAADPAGAQALATPFYKDPSLTKTRIAAAMQKAASFPQADGSNMAAIGYCFGGYSVLNAAKLGAGLKGVVVFHGGLGGAPADKKLLKAKILVCNGGADRFVSAEEIASFRHAMDSIGAVYTFKSYPGATHAFTNPASTANGKKFNMPIEYNAAADKQSWDDMKAFLAALFGSASTHR